MYTRILVGTDGSDTAWKAVEIAARLAEQYGATLHLVAARSTRSGGVTVPLAGVTAADSGMGDALAADRSRAILTEAAQRFPDLPTELHTPLGEPAEAIVRVAEEIGADLIVVGSKGMNRRVLGSIPNSVAHNAPCSVLIAKTV